MREAWEHIHRRFDPMGPPAESQWRAERPHGPLRQISKRLDRRFQHHRILLSGTIGTGKSTELTALARARSADDFVVFLDVQRHLAEVLNDGEALQHIEAWELALLMTLAAFRAASDVLPDDWRCSSLGMLEDAWSQLLPSADTIRDRAEIGQLVGSMALATSDLVADGAHSALKLVERVVSAVPWDRPIGRLPGSITEQDPRVVNLIDAANRVLGELRATIRAHSSPDREILLIVDGLDRIRDRDAAVRLLTRSDSLAKLNCWQIMTAPFALRHDPALADARGFVPFTLVNEPVLDHADPTRPNARAIEFFEDVFAQRTHDLPDGLFAPAQIAKLAFYSGGRVRDFVYFVQEIAGFAWDADADAVDDEMIESVLHDRRRLIESGLWKPDLDLLSKIADLPHQRLEPTENLKRLLTHGILLPYPNDSEWFYPHPLLTLGPLLDP